MDNGSMILQLLSEQTTPQYTWHRVANQFGVCCLILDAGLVQCMIDTGSQPIRFFEEPSSEIFIATLINTAYSDFITNTLFAFRTLPNSMKLTFCNGTVLHRNQVRSTFGDWLNGITELSKSLQAIDIDASAYACLSALTLVNGESI